MSLFRKFSDLMPQQGHAGGGKLQGQWTQTPGSLLVMAKPDQLPNRRLADAAEPDDEPSWWIQALSTPGAQRGRLLPGCSKSCSGWRGEA
jgi:hypothetical protein